MRLLLILIILLSQSLFARSIASSTEPVHIDEIIDAKSFKSFSWNKKFNLNRIFIIKDLVNDDVIGLAELKDILPLENGKYENIFYLTKVVDNQIIQVGSELKEMDLASYNENYKGSTELLIKKNQSSVSSRYKPIFTQGVVAGDTAETLEKDEFIITYLGQIYYGFFPSITLGTSAPLSAAGGLNFSSKIRLLSTEQNTLSTGLNFTRIPQSDQSTLNLTFLWDSYSNSSLITHNYLSLAVLSYDKAEETTAIKSFASSSIQTGYEFILPGWDRILVGPNYNFEKKSIGGYLAYVKIWDRLHVHLSLNTIDIRKVEWSYTEGYYMFLDVYWRF
ncbi:MAG: hypothetical protein KDD45_03145 [Bdellovibrionales bacterium]|nr:hypothetical protein [Bdellovibrionales bacterium]